MKRVDRRAIPDLVIRTLQTETGEKQMKLRSIMIAVGIVILTGPGTAPLVAQAKPKPVSHDIAGREQCLMCHKAGAMEPVPDAPASHEGREAKHCTLCHKPAG